MKINEGDLFAFPFRENKCGVGQVLECNTSLYICVYSNIHKCTCVDLGDLGEVILLGWTQDASIYNKRWKLIGIHDKPENITYHKFKLPIEGKLLYITDHRGRKIRPVKTANEAALPFWFSMSPIAYEKAFRAFHSGDWEERFDSILTVNIK